MTDRRSFLSRALAGLCLAVGGGLVSLPGVGRAAGKGRSTGLPVPRFVSLNPDRVNLRAGPGLRYPVEWVYRRAGMPVEVIGEFETWRQIRDWEGTTGWVHAAMLQARRTARIVGGEPRLLRAAPEHGARPVAMLEPGVIATIESCRGNWCELSVGSHTGWLPRTQFYGTYPGETLE